VKGRLREQERRLRKVKVRIDGISGEVWKYGEEMLGEVDVEVLRQGVER